jgi:transposase
VHDSRRSQPGLSESTISKIAGIVFQPKGATLTEAARLLAVSRVTAIRWLALMESEGLLVRTQVMSGRRGRPQVVYRPTDKLMKLVETHNSGSIAIFSFPTLKGSCKHLVEGNCSFRTKSELCGAAICPLLHF